MKIALICYAVPVPDDAEQVPDEYASAVPEGAPVACEFFDGNVTPETMSLAGGNLARSIGEYVSATGVDQITQEIAA